MAVTVFYFEFVVLIPVHLEASVIGLFLLNSKLLGCIRSNFHRDFYNFWILNGPYNLMAADSPAFQAPVPATTLTLGMANFNKSTGCGCSFHRTHSNSHHVVTNRHFLKRNNHASGSMCQFKIRACITMRQTRIVFVEGKASIYLTI